MQKIKTVPIHDNVFEETYTAHITQNGTTWTGDIPDVPTVKCEAGTEAALVKTLEKTLHDALVAEEEAWEQQFETDVKAGKLDCGSAGVSSQSRRNRNLLFVNTNKSPPIRRLAEEALEDVRAGKYYSIEVLRKL